MNVLLMSLLYPENRLSEVMRNAKDGLQNQINSYQRAFVRGMDEKLEAGERLEIVNALPVGTFPVHYRKLILRGGANGSRMRELGGVNLPWLKQWGRELRARRAICKWMGESEQNRTVLVYSLYLPYMRAVAAVKRRHPELRACVIVTDLPNELGISSGRRGLLKRIEYRMGNRKTRLCAAFDGFVLLTAAMAEALPVARKKLMVMEGLILTDTPLSGEAQAPDDGKPKVLYTGTLNRELGIGELLEAFQGLPECELWLCGKGDMEQEAKDAAERFANIRYFGFVPQKEALLLQARATLLINPRSAQGVFTRYSFPSKTLEYMRSGKPVLCYPLEGIPEDYAPYLYWIQKEGPSGIREAVRALLSRPPQELAKRGNAARSYVLANKNPAAQCARLLQFLREL